MKFNGTELILDNFRDLLFSYSIDIQDVVRSSILDNVDICPYIQDCVNSPFKLDQIRLALKEGMMKDEYLFLTGEMLFQIRKMSKRGVSLTQVQKQLQNGLSEEYIIYLLQWVDDGINLSKLNIGIIPKSLLDTFDYGLRGGFDMSLFNNGVTFPIKYVMNCLQILNNGKSITFLLSGDWDLPCVEYLNKFSKVSNKVWSALVNNIAPNTSLERLKLLALLVKANVSIVKLQEKVDSKQLYNNKCLSILHSGLLLDLDIDELMTETNPEKMEQLKSKLELAKKKTISGRLVRNN